MRGAGVRKILGGLAAAALGAGALAGCAGAEAERAIRAQTELVGMRKADLLACAGVPHRTAETGEVEVLRYERTQVLVDRKVDVEESPVSRMLRARGGGGPPFFERQVREWRIPYTCEATFTLRGGVVEGVTYNQNRDIQQCHAIVGNCMSPGPG
jgi:hypothetical protein